MAKQKNKYAVALGSLGGKKRAQNMTPARRKEIAKLGAKARWEKKNERPENSR